VRHLKNTRSDDIVHDAYTMTHLAPQERLTAEPPTLILRARSLTGPKVAVSGRGQQAEIDR
jgi:hypothetical protein